MKVTKVGNRLAKGLVGRITVAVDPTATPALIGIHGSSSPPCPAERG